MAAEDILLTFHIIEGRHFHWPHMNSYVQVEVMNKMENTQIQYNTDCPFFNEYLVFELHTKLEDFLDANVLITVMEPRRFLFPQKILGIIKLDIATVWQQSDHMFYHKWGIITDDTGNLMKGFLKLDLYFVRKGEVLKFPEYFADSEQIEENILMPKGYALERQRSNYVFNVYYGKLLSTDAAPSLSTTNDSGPPSVSVEVSFAGIKGKTSVQTSYQPEWNQGIIFAEYFPSLSQRITIYLYYDGKVVATRKIDLRYISDPSDRGFLPTWGPSFIYFYLNESQLYIGKVLLSINTEITGIMATATIGNEVTLRNVVPVKERKLWLVDTVLLFAAILDVNNGCNEYLGKPISFMLGFDDVEEVEGNHQPPVVAEANQCQRWVLYNYPYKPCLYKLLQCADLRKQMFGSNIIANISQELKKKLRSAEEVFEKHNFKPPDYEWKSICHNIVDFLTSSCRQYVDITQGDLSVGKTTVEKKRTKLALMKMKQIETSMKECCKKELNKDCFNKIQECVEELDLLADEAQEYWPDIFLWMLSDNKKIGYFRIPAKNVIFSKIEEEKGKFCGKVIDIYLQTTEKPYVHEGSPSDILCIARVFFWIGLQRQKDMCLKLLPKGFLTFGDIPTQIQSKEIHYFEARIHLYQGKFYFAADHSGLSDCYVIVIFGDQTLECQVIYNSNNPVWNRTLTFTSIAICGDITFIQSQPPQACLEVWDKEKRTSSEYMGRGFSKPFVKLINNQHNSVPQFSWEKINDKETVMGEVLCMTELIQIDKPVKGAKENKIEEISKLILPHTLKYRIEIYFWGIRNLQQSHCRIFGSGKVKIAVEYNEYVLESNRIENELNFLGVIKFMIPIVNKYASPLCIKMLDCQSYGRIALNGSQLLPLAQFFCSPLTAFQRELVLLLLTEKVPTSRMLNIRRHSKTVTDEQDMFMSMCGLCKTKKKKNTRTFKIRKNPSENLEEEDEDWWCKYNRSLMRTNQKVRFESEKSLKSTITSVAQLSNRLKIYNNELEKQPEFEKFQDLLCNIPLVKAKLLSTKLISNAHIKGLLKALIKVYPSPDTWTEPLVTDSGLSLNNGAFQDLPLNDKLPFLARVYCVKALGLSPKDASGKSDPYICISLGKKQIVNDKNNYISNQLEPIFGRCFEVSGSFGVDHEIVVSLWDWDLLSANDLIGETRIDLENRFYSLHRGQCGLSFVYHRSGTCMWRDQLKPTQILNKLCTKYNIYPIDYYDKSVRVGSRIFHIPLDAAIYGMNSETKKENFALYVLHHWQEFPIIGRHLVPEHIETRSLYHPAKPGLEQGKLQMWVDIFPLNEHSAPQKIDITPRKPIAYELRVIIWNVEDVLLDEADFLSGGRKSDLFIQGWMSDQTSCQRTDVHYRSLDGEGSFNWRFIFKFDYLHTENKMIVSKKESMFAWDTTEFKMPCKLTLEILDSDTFSTDDFLGALTLDLSYFPRGAKDAKRCSFDNAPDSPKLNLFKAKRTRAWWPFYGIHGENGSEILAGKVEMELHLLTIEEAEKSPAGFGREAPQPLPPPKRPDTSFFWLTNPLKALRQLLCKRFKWHFLMCLLLGIVAFAVFATFIAVPRMLLQKFLGIH